MANEQLQNTIETLHERRLKRERMTRIGWIVAGVCALILLVCLMVPAFTLEHNKYDCGLEEHTHTAQCYTNEVVCGLPTEKAHVHTPSCYSKSGKLTCNKKEAGHIHLDPCYDKNGKLTCDKEETVHIHKASCFDKNGNNICKNKDALHVHGDTCYTEVKSASDKSSKDADDEKDSKATKEPVAYQLTCNEESVGHVHRDACYNENGKLVCDKEEKIEIPHKHDESCYEKVLACGQEEHTHTDECLKEEVPSTPAVDENGNLLDGDTTDNVEGDSVADENVDLVDESAEPDLTDQEITEAEDQGLLYENNDIVVAFNVPDNIKDSIKLKVTETDKEVVPYSDQDLSQFVPKPEDEVVVENGEGDIEVANIEEANGESTDAANNTDAASTTDQNAIATSAEEEPVYKTNLHVEATLNGEPVEDIASLGITAKLQVKSQVISPILKGINYKNAAPEAKNNVGAEISVLQQPAAPANAASLSELPDAQLDEVMVTNIKNAATTYSVVDSDGTIRVTGIANPKFTVQFYALVDEFDEEKTNDDKSVQIIDTTGGKLPKNGSTTSPNNGNKLKNLVLEKSGSNYVPKTKRVLKEMYSPEPDNWYIEKPNAYYFNKLQENGNYEITEAWVMKEGVSEEEANSEEVCEDIAKASEYWNIYIYSDSDYSEGYEKQWGKNYEQYCKVVKSFNFTNRDDESLKDKYIYIADNSIIRLVNAVTKEEKTDGTVEFYDYDISDGNIYRKKPESVSGYKNHKIAGDVFDSNNKLNQSILDWAGALTEGNGWDQHLYTVTQEKGINSSSNYSGSDTKLAFGNVNTGTGLGKLKWSGNELNKYNNKGYQGCTFGLVSGLTSDGKLIYSSGIDAPKLFNEGSATGKTSYVNDPDGDTLYSLEFNRVGDSYTLSAVNGTKATGLDSFSNPTNSTGTHTTIYTNDFWPMDSAPSFGSGTHDVKFGGTATFKKQTHEIRFGPTTEKGTDYTFPESDDGLYHNSYFGMHFNVDFDLSADYIGPLDYLFYGDDDLWVFLSEREGEGKNATLSKSQLVVDIGGVHSSVGEYTNLWDYIKKGSSGKYRLSIFYTERGASGSTCFMNYTLPSVSFPNSESQVTGSLEISKVVEGDIDDPNEDFKFEIELYDSVINEDNRLIDDYAYTRYKADGTAYEYTDDNGNPVSTDLLLHDQGEFVLKAGEYIRITNLPIDTVFKIKEIDENDTYITTSTVTPSSNAVTTEDKDNGGKVISGNITTGKTTVYVEYINRQPYQLPDTGGIGAYWFWICGGALIGIGVMTIMWQRRRSTVSAR